MTTVRTTPATPPPRLPVRDKAAALGRGWGGVSPMLTRLAAERATGVLVRERGTLHLADGKVVHAESPAAPGAHVLLAAHGTLDAEVWRRALAESAASAAGAADAGNPESAGLAGGAGIVGTGAHRLTGADVVHHAGHAAGRGRAAHPGCPGDVPADRPVRRGVLRARPEQQPGPLPLRHRGRARRPRRRTRRARRRTRQRTVANPAVSTATPSPVPASRIPSRSPPWSARHCGGVTCCTASGRTRCRTRCR